MEFPSVTLFIIITWLCGSYGLSTRLREDKSSGAPIANGRLSTKPYRGPLPTSGATKHIGMKSGQPSRYDNTYIDPLWDKQWHLHDYRTVEGPVMDHNVVPVHWMNITGYGVNVAILADGVEQNHPDLLRHVVEEVEATDDESIGAEKLEDTLPWIYQVAGTQVAGVVAMAANNSHCGVGIAFNAEIFSIKIGRHVGSSGLANAFVHNLYFYNEIDIYVNTWGVDDDGEGLMGDIPGLLDSINYGADQGRRCKGAIYVMDVGNGKGDSRDNCAADALVNSPHTIAVAGASHTGKTTAYSERCPGVFATAYAGDSAADEEGIVATEAGGKCSTEFQGTAAAAAVATGIIALVLEANPSLTLRDVHHLITMSAEVAPLADNPKSWYRNGAGFWVSNDFGFGLMNAENMVLLAKTWTRVPDKAVCNVKFDLKDITIEEGKKYVTTHFTNACQYNKGEWVNFLEAVEVELHVQHHYRGAIAMKITSPLGTDTVVLETRPLDKTREKFKGLRIKTLHNWGENPLGLWKVVVEIAPYQKSTYEQIIDTVVKITKQTVTCGLKGNYGLHGVSLVLHGTTIPPAHYGPRPRTYSAFSLEDGRSSEDPFKKKCNVDRSISRCIS